MLSQVQFVFWDEDPSTGAATAASEGTGEFSEQFASGTPMSSRQTQVGVEGTENDLADHIGRQGFKFRVEVVLMRFSQGHGVS